MHHYIPPETKLKIRAAILSGRSRADIAKEFGISNATVCRATVDLPKNEARAKRLKPGDKERLRELVKGGMSKYQAAKEIGISQVYACILTRDLPSPSKRGGNRNFGERTIEIVQDILRDGYVMSDNELILGTKDYIMLLRYFPVKRIHYKHYMVYYLQDRKEEAFKGFVKTVGSRVLTYSKLKEVAGLFGLPLDGKMRAQIIGKEGENKDKMFKLSHESKRSLRRLKAQNPDFIGSFIPSELLWNRLRQNRRKEGLGLPECS